jgi:hypothetical protein
MKLRHLILTVCVLMAATACEKDDKEIPYGLQGFEAWVYDKQTGAPHRAGRFTASYLEREKGLSQCRDAAFALVREKQLDDWDFICCTMTHSSNCASKVR